MPSPAKTPPESPTRKVSGQFTADTLGQSQLGATSAASTSSFNNLSQNQSVPQQKPLPTPSPSSSLFPDRQPRQNVPHAAANFASSAPGSQAPISPSTSGTSNRSHIPDNLTEHEKRQLVTARRLKALDMGMQRQLTKCKDISTEFNALTKFYLTRKQSILDAGGLPLESTAGNKRKVSNESNIAGKRSKTGPSTQASNQQMSSSHQPASSNHQQASSPLPANRPSSQVPSTEMSRSKRKADEDLPNSTKKTRNGSQMDSSPLSSSAAGSQTSNLFKGILGNKDEEQESNELTSPPESLQNRSSTKASRASKAPILPAAQETGQPATVPPLFAVPPQNPINFEQKTPQSKFASTGSSVSAQPAMPSTPAIFGSQSTMSNSKISDSTKPGVLQVPKFGDAVPRNFVLEFGKAATNVEKSAEKETKKRPFESGEVDQSEVQNKDTEASRAKKQRKEESANANPTSSDAGKGFGFPAVEKQGTSQAASRASSPAVSIFDQPYSAKTTTNNIFAHLSDHDSAAEGSKTGDADDEGTDDEDGQDEDDRDGQEDNITQTKTTLVNPSKSLQPLASTNPFGTPFQSKSVQSSKNTSDQAAPASRSLFDYLDKDKGGKVSKESNAAEAKQADSSQANSSNKDGASVKSTTSPSPNSSSGIFSQTSSLFNLTKPSIVDSKGGSIFGQSQSAPQAAVGSPEPQNSSPGDHTWKADSPIKFGSPSGAPDVRITSPSPTKPATLSGLFGSPKSTSTVETTTKPMTSIFGTPLPKTGDVGFSFGPSSSAKPSNTLFPTSNSGSSALFPNIASNTTSRATSPGASTAGESANESQADGAEEATSAGELFNLSGGGPGEEDEDRVFEIRAKAMSFDAKEKVWTNKGVGPLRVLKHRETSSTRVLMRQDPSGRIVLNSALMGRVKYEHAQKNMVRIVVATDAGKLETYMVKVAKDEDAEKLASLLEANKAN